MTFETFITSLAANQVPEELNVLQKALWYAKKGDWDQAHELAQSLHTSEAAWVHAYLHRAEGDLWNADYWYRQAQKSRPAYSLKEEWEQISKALLG
ncbi:MAG: hypothetical protein NW226_02960 [Microscillaceae bacterium]|nr:hypothetical protein [Microscillaceae bacterium]